MQGPPFPQAPQNRNNEEWTAWLASLADKNFAFSKIDTKELGGLRLNEWCKDLYEKCRTKTKKPSTSTQRSHMWDAYTFLKEYLTRFASFSSYSCSASQRNTTLPTLRSKHNATQHNTPLPTLFNTTQHNTTKRKITIYNIKQRYTISSSCSGKLWL